MVEQEQGIVAGEVIVLYVDQCHLVWKDACGYVWGPSSERMPIPIVNGRERQTYYGAIEPIKGELTGILAEAGNSYWTCIFVEYLRQHYSGKRLIICWDGASYHRGSEMCAYLEAVNKGFSPQDWPVTCIRFAPNAPEQNPIEDIWLRGKTFIRTNWRRCDNTFSSVTALFEEALETMTFNFKKLRMYMQCLHLI